MDNFSELISAAHNGAAGIGSGKVISAEQARSGNYRKGRVSLYGFNIAIETPAGQRRTGKSNGEPWSVICMAHYGDISGTKGADGDPLDVFVGSWPESDRAYVVNRYNQDGRFDEHKILLAFPDASSALNAYRNSYERGQDGLKSFVPCSIDQLKWWIKFGDHSVPMTPKSLPYDGSTDMTETAWDSNAMPIGSELPDMIYRLRRDDFDGLLLDSVSIPDILEESEHGILDALVLPFNKLELKMTQLLSIMKATGESVKPVSMQVTEPFKQRGTTNIAVIYELSDGQTITVFFHNPDSTPNKLTPSDEMVSWKWMLNKKDVTIVVAPENGKDLNPREVSRRIMRLAERNSDRFKAANVKRAERMSSIESLRNSATAKQQELDQLYADIDSAEARLEEKKNAPVVVPAALQNELHDETGATVAETAGEPTVATTEEPAVVEAQADTGREPFKSGERVYIKPEFQDRGDELFVRVAVDDEDGGRLMVRTMGTGITVGGGPTAVMEADMLERRTQAEQEAIEAQKGILSPEGYAIAQKIPSILALHQDKLDSFFQERIIAVRNSMRELDWFGTDAVMTKGDYRFTFAVATVGAGSNVVGVKYQIMDPKDVEVIGIVDDLTKSPAEIAAALDASLPVVEADDFETDLIRGIEIAKGMGKVWSVTDIAGASGEYGDRGTLLFKGSKEDAYKFFRAFQRPDVDPDSEVVAAAVEAAKRGAGGITKILTGQYFTFDFEGEDLILTDELRAKVETALGTKLVEKVFPGLEGEVALVSDEGKSGEGEFFTEDEIRARAAAETETSLADIALLQAVINGTASFLDPGLADSLTEIYNRNQNDPSMMDLFSKAAKAYSEFVVKEAGKVF